MKLDRCRSPRTVRQDALFFLVNAGKLEAGLLLFARSRSSPKNVPESTYKQKEISMRAIRYFAVLMLQYSQPLWPLDRPRKAAFLARCRIRREQ